MKTKFVIAVLLLTTWPSLAEACIRCRRAVCICPKVMPLVAAPVPYLAPPNVLIAQINYPSPLVAQGATQYASAGYQQTVIPLVDPNIFLSASNLLLRDAYNGVNLAQARVVGTFNRVAELQAPAVERLAAGQAAALTLTAAGLGPNAAPPSTNAVVISRDAFGRVQAVPASPELLAANGYGQTYGAKAAAVAAPYPLLDQFCLRCHGAELAQAKGGLTLGWTDELAAGMEARYFKLAKNINTRKMPPAGSPQPTDEQRAGILAELDAIISGVKMAEVPGPMP